MLVGVDEVGDGVIGDHHPGHHDQKVQEEEDDAEDDSARRSRPRLFFLIVIATYKISMVFIMRHIYSINRISDLNKDGKLHFL